MILSESNFATSINDKGGSHIDYSVAAFVEMPIKRSIKRRWWQGITAKKMIDNEFLFRTSIASDIITNILFVILIIFLYRLFRQVNELLALFMAGLAFVALPVSFIGESLRLIALEIFKGNLLRSFSTEQALEVSTTLLKVDSYTGQLVTFHWGLWLIPMGWLVYRSGFIPKILGILLFVNGLGYMISSITFILFPESLPAVSKIVYPTYFIGELPLIFWLMIKGIRSNYKLKIEPSMA